MIDKFGFSCEKGSSCGAIGTVTGTERLSNARYAKLSVAGITNGGENYEMNLRVLPCEHFASIKCPNIDDAKNYPILKKAMHNIPVDFPQVSMIISMKNWNLHKPLSCESVPNGPTIIQTPLGYSIIGPTCQRLVNSEQSVDSGQNICNNILSLKEISDRLYKIDDVENLFCTWKNPSVEEQRAQSIMENSVQRKEDGQPEVQTPYKDDEATFPDNYSQAEACIEAQRKQFKKNPAYFDEYKGKIIDHKEADHVEKVPSNKIATRPGRRFFLIPHGVRHRLKKKLRIVWNLSKLYKGISINGCILSCPDLLNKMIGLVIRFREFPVAVVGDIQGFYLAVLTPEKDWDLARFLWFENDDVNGALVQYRMKVHLFGGIASQAAAIIALKKVINDAVVDGIISQSEAEEFIRAFYSDDHLNSHNDTKSAINYTQKLKHVLKTGKFVLTKFCSNRPEVVDALESKKQEKQDELVDIFNDIETTALGLLWNASKDCLMFHYECPEIPNSPREALSSLMKLFDLLGLVAPYTLPLKKIVRSLVCSEKAWDEKLDDEERKELELCLLSLQNLHKLNIPRHVGGEINSTVRQLHVFTDGSEHCYGACAYLRTVNSNGKITSSLLLSKSKLTPQKKMLTIPKIELCGNVMGVRVSKIIRDEVRMPFHQIFYWTDSMCVLGMIRNETKRFPRFIGNRLAEIHAVSDASQFGYVESSCNPADILSRGRNFDFPREVDEKWLTGAPFLLVDESEWPEQPGDIKDADEFVVNVVQSIAKWYIKLNSWFRLQYHAAMIIRMRNILLSKVRVKKGLPALELHKGKVTVGELTAAGRFVLICYQQDSFPEEMDCLTDNRPVPLDSPLRCLNPKLLKGLICVGGRLKNANNVPLAQKYPIILPTSGHITELLIDLSHIVSGHGSVNMVLTELRLRYWVINPKRSVRNVVQKCIPCGRYSARVGEQIMADLPADRVDLGCLPFTHCGVDLFGHFFVKRARSDLKRYVALFTCLTTRCVHLEVCESLDMHDFLEAFRMLAIRRGLPETLRSDRGTDFVASNTEIQTAIEEWNESGISHELLQKGTTWIFNPPKASHFGGAWERLNRMARKSLRHVLFDKTITDRSFRTLICEIEGILNSRPLTEFSSDHEDLRPLTPYDILLLRPNPPYPPGLFTKEDSYLLKSYKAAQHHANVFWTRFRQEYLPQLQERSKWVTTRRDFKISDLVLLVDEKAKRGQWKLGRIVKVYKSDDDRIRSIRVKCTSGEYDRPIDKICLLEASS